MHTAYGSWRSAPHPDATSCPAFEWVEFPHVQVVLHTSLAVLYRISGRLVMVAPVHIGLVSTARQPGEVGTLVLPRWLAGELGMLHAHLERAA